MHHRRPSKLLACALALAVVLLPRQQIVAQTQPSTQQNQKATTHKLAPNQNNVNCGNNGTYVNSAGQTVKKPENCSGPPKGATAQCHDGTYSFSQNRRGTCFHHGGVAKWL